MSYKNQINSKQVDEVLPENKKDRDAILAMLKDEPEINHKVDYYKGLLKSQALLIEALDEKINKSHEVVKHKIFGFIPIISSRRVSDYEKQKFLLEKIEAENQLRYWKQYFENWLQRKNEFEQYYDKLTAECNQNFDQLYAGAKEVAKTNIRLSSSISKYEKSADKNDQQLKNEFYLYIKQEVRNSMELGARKPVKN